MADQLIAGVDFVSLPTHDIEGGRDVLRRDSAYLDRRSGPTGASPSSRPGT
ncbi:MAG: hypothetical protein M3065_09780 [Actinomycetota bacterium]|nr:hypothetical protein [Actinomycetota bacterium]